MYTNNFNLSFLVLDVGDAMHHPGVPGALVLSALAVMSLLLVWYLSSPARLQAAAGIDSLATAAADSGHCRVPAWLLRLMRNYRLLVVLRVLVASFFLLIVYAGLFGTPYPARNMATVMTWTVWWTTVVLAVLFVGTLWCAVCPWDNIAAWLVKRRLWRRQPRPYSLEMRVPRALRGVSVAALLFIALSWLELGYGITLSPYATAVLALAMVVAASVSILLFERRSFCRHFCPVGRTLGFYSHLSVTALRPLDPARCSDCRTLECYHGTAEVDPCPTQIVIGRTKQNTYCISCGNCVVSCPHRNVGWRLRMPGSESMRAHATSAEAGFIVILLSLALFHGITMLPVWEPGINALSRFLSTIGIRYHTYLVSFSLVMLVSVLLPWLLYTGVARLAWFSSGRRGSARQWFSDLAFALIPIAFFYHVAHNLAHLARETHDLKAVLLNPAGWGALPLSGAEKHFRHLNPVIDQQLVFVLQVMLLTVGFWLSARIARSQVRKLVAVEGAQRSVGARGLLPVLLFSFLLSGFGLWLLMQPMAMRGG